jgi:hypothetical protein
MNREFYIFKANAGEFLWFLLIFQNFSDSVHVYSVGPKSINKEVRKYCCLFNKMKGCNYSFVHSPFS